MVKGRMKTVTYWLKYVVPVFESKSIDVIFSKLK